jgi:LysM repeat protein
VQKRQEASHKRSARYTAINRLFGRSKKRSTRIAIFAANILIFAAVGILVATNSSSADQKPNLSTLGVAGSEEIASNPLDEISSADIAVNVARQTNLAEATAVTNTADSENASLAVSSSDDTVVSKPQVISDGLKSNKDIVHYTVQKGDDVPGVAEKFGITSETLKLSNNLDSDSLTSGMDLVISPVDGLVYRVQPGDTPESLASKYRANADQIIAFNDVELTGRLKPGVLIVIPDGSQPKEHHFVFPVANQGGGATFSLGGGSGYAFGWCTYYAAARSGAPPGWGNAATWAYYAALDGWTVSSVPRVGAIAQTNRNHVGIVEWVSPDGSMIKYSDMNGIAGFNRVGYSGEVPAHSVFQHFIYR